MERARRYNLKNVINKCRELLEDDFTTQLRKLGIFIEEDRENLPIEQMTHLSDADKEIRLWIEEAIQVQQKGKLSEKQAVQRYIRHCSFTFLNRISALRAMEVRGLIEESVIVRDKYGGRSIRGRNLQESHPEWTENEILKNVFLDAFNEVGSEINVLFDINDGLSFLFPSNKICRELIKLISQDISEEDWLTDEILGWIYQFFNSKQREEFKQQGTQRKRHPFPDDITVTNQFYTPKWIVKMLVQNSLGRLWTEMNLDSNKFTEWEFYINKDFISNREEKVLEKLKILDSACGSGHFLIYSFEVLYDLYKEKYPDWNTQKICSTIFNNNLYGIDIDLRAIQIAAINLFLKAKTYDSNLKITKMNLICADAQNCFGRIQS